MILLFIVRPFLHETRFLIQFSSDYYNIYQKYNFRSHLHEIRFIGT